MIAPKLCLGGWTVRWRICSGVGSNDVVRSAKIQRLNVRLRRKVAQAYKLIEHA